MRISSWDVLERIRNEHSKLSELARGRVRKLPLLADYPAPPLAGEIPDGARIYTPSMQGAVWGRSDQLTLSLLKTDVFDRRFVARKPMTLDEIVQGAYSEANRDFDDLPHSGKVRAVWGALDKEGGRRDCEAWSQMYPFPCQKPVGQITLSAEGSKAALEVTAEQEYASGMVALTPQDDAFSLSCLMCMEQNTIALRLQNRSPKEQFRLRLYRHKDQGHRKYMNEDGSYLAREKRMVTYTPADINKPLEYYDLEADAAINQPFEAPVSGKDGRFFWVWQKFPAEETFPEGLEYVMMGLVEQDDAQLSVHGLQKGLGHAPRMPRNSNGTIRISKGFEEYAALFYEQERSYQLFAQAEGVAADAELKVKKDGCCTVYLTVVTSNESQDVFAAAKQQLLNAEKMGFAGLKQQNASWYDRLYEKRERGRFFVHGSRGEQERLDEEMMVNAFSSWGISDGGFCDPDPGKYEGSECYANFDVDAQLWHSLPCYNEIFSEPAFVRDQYEPFLYYYRLIQAWMPGLQGKAREIYNLPGMILPHGYLPPAKPNPWYMENQTLDLCLDVAGQVMKCVWNVWDYGGDEQALRSVIYPAMRELAIFYDAYARRNDDGRYFNIEPAVETENWGISYRMEYTRNPTCALAMFRFVLERAAQAAEYLGVDDALAQRWKETAARLAPYPVFRVSSGEILGGIPACMPRWTDGDHPWFTGDYPALLADEVNLDSSTEVKERIARTDDTVRTDHNQYTYVLVGKCREDVPPDIHHSARRIADDAMLIQELFKRPERLLNSRGERIHLFPVVPDWAKVTICDFLARGGFEISASYAQGAVQALTIKARRTAVCTLALVRCDGVVDRTTGARVELVVQPDRMSFAACAGHEYDFLFERDSEDAGR